GSDRGPDVRGWVIALYAIENDTDGGEAAEDIDAAIGTRRGRKISSRRVHGFHCGPGVEAWRVAFHGGEAVARTIIAAEGIDLAIEAVGAGEEAAGGRHGRHRRPRGKQIPVFQDFETRFAGPSAPPLRAHVLPEPRRR